MATSNHSQMVSLVIVTKHLGSDGYKIQYKFIIACCLVILTNLLYVLKNLLVAQFFTNQNQNISIFALQSIITFIVSTPMNVMFLISWLNGFEFEAIDLFYGTIIGCLGAILLYLSVFIVVKGKAGSADALMETNTFILGLMDWLLFSRKPTLIQLICIGLAFCSTLVIIFGNQFRNNR